MVMQIFTFSTDLTFFSMYLRIRSISTSLICFLCLSSSMVAQSPWTPGHNKGYSHLAFSTLYKYNQIFEGNLNNLTPLDGTISEFTLQSYTEYGIGDQLGIILSVPLRSITTAPAATSTLIGSGDLIGLGNIELGLKYKILDGATTAALGLTVSLNTSREHSDENLGIRTGYDAVGVSPFLSIGRGFDRSYLYGNIGYEANSNDFSDFLKFEIEYGRKYWDQLWIIAAFNLKEIASKSEKTFAPAQALTRLYINDQFYNSLSLKLIYEQSDKAGFNFSANLISIRANNLPFRSPLSVGYYRKW